MQPVESCCAAIFYATFKRIIFYKNSSKIKLFLQKKCKNFDRWGLRPQTPKTAPPLKISVYAPGLPGRTCTPKVVSFMTKQKFLRQIFEWIINYC